jgi:hypothetical protein
MKVSVLSEADVQVISDVFVLEGARTVPLIPTSGEIDATLRVLKQKRVTVHDTCGARYSH